VITLAQRAEATVVGAFERDQSLTRLTFGVSDANTVKMLHSDVPEDVIATHAASPKGTALLTAPQLPLARIRGPWVGSYGAYVDLVADASASPEVAA
jgi:S-DNA-T family DNA segregation ATPase FtsK/SpoIIIE